MFCVFCGKQIADDSKFCVHCGKSCTPAAPVQKAPASPVQRVAPPPAAPEKSGSAKPILIGIIIALLVVVLGIGIYLVVTELLPAMDDWDGFGVAQKQEADPDDERPNRTEETKKPRPNREENTATEELEGLPASNPYRDCFENYPDFVLPESDSRYYSYSDITHLSAEALTIAYQEIFARYGDTFVEEDLQAYFDARAWYDADDGFHEFNSYELSNITLLRVQLDLRNGNLYSNGNTYIDLYGFEDYAIPTSNSRLLTNSDLSRLSKNQLCVVRAEILARHGCIFEDTELQEYFCSKSWYCPSVPESQFNRNLLNQYERSNLDLIDNPDQSSSQEVPNAYWSPDNPYKVIYESYGRRQVYFFPDSSTRRLTSSDISGMNIDELCLARNEIWARNGYLFGDDHLREYFQHFSWYHPTTAIGDQDAMNFNDIEYENIRFLRARQTALENN